MAEISKITSTQGVTYDLKDTQARNDIAAIQAAISGGVTFMGQTTTALTDGATTKSITINSASVTAVKGYLVVYNSKEFVFDGTKWIEMGDLSLIGDLGWKDSASGSFTPAGTVSQPNFTGNEMTATGKFTPAVTVSLSLGDTSSTGSVGVVNEVSASFSGDSATIKPKVTAAGTVTIAKGTGTANYTPEGSVAAPTISVKTAGSTASVTPFGGLGTLPTFATRVTGETLTFEFDEGVLPTPGTAVTVKTGDAAYQASAPAFTGTGAELKATFTGTEVTGSASYTPTGSVSTAVGKKHLSATSSGTEGTISVKGTPTGTVSKPTFTGTAGTVTVS